MVSHGEFVNGVHRISFRIYYEDTDAGGIVYHANYLKFTERARTEMLRALGLHQSDLVKEYGILFVVRRVEIDYLKPAMLDDTIRVETSVDTMSTTSFTLRQHIFRDDVRLADTLVVIVCVNPAMRPVKVPERVKGLLVRG